MTNLFYLNLICLIYPFKRREKRLRDRERSLSMGEKKSGSSLRQHLPIKETRRFQASLQQESGRSLDLNRISFTVEENFDVSRKYQCTLFTQEDRTKQTQRTGNKI